MKTLEKHIKDNEFSKNYLLCGEEDYLRKLYKDKLKSAIIGDNLTMNYSYYEGKNIDPSEVIDEANTLPFFSDRKLIIIENSEFFSVQNNLADNLSGFPESTIIIFIEEKVDKRTKLYKQIKKLGTVTDFKKLSERNLEIFIASLLKKDKMRITTRNVAYLLEKIGPNMVNIVSEVEKLISYAYGREEITKADIDAVCTEQTEGKIFQMIDAITNKDIDTALDLYYDLLELNESPNSILFLLSRHFKILIQTKDLYKRGVGNNEIARKAGVNSYFVNKYISQGRKFYMNTLENNLSLCNTTEADIKTGNQQAQLGVEVLIIQFAN